MDPHIIVFFNYKSNLFPISLIVTLEFIKFA